MRVALNDSKIATEKPQNNKRTVKGIRSALPKILLYALLIILAFICIFPLYIAFCNATQKNDIIAQIVVILPSSDFFTNYERLIQLNLMPEGFKNSLLTSVPVAFISTYLGGLAAFAFAKYKFKGNKFLFAVVIFSLVMPLQIAIPGLYKVCEKLHITNTLLPLIFPAIANAGIVFFVKYSIQSAVIDSVMEAARIDGCGEFRIFNSIVLPMIIPALATMAVLAFIANWNGLIIPLTFFHSPHENLFTLPMWALYTKGIYGNDYGAIYAGLAVSLVPAIVFSLFSKYIIGGLTSGIIKIYQAE